MAVGTPLSPAEISMFSRKQQPSAEIHKDDIAIKDQSDEDSARLNQSKMDNEIDSFVVNASEYLK